ncbi:hypothetical protein [Streptomyces goshikiensis]|uniref:hypothetical protein n=1 Tax=Streptomyces goshikiensis TaxID=1942 RepID=UPI0037B19FBF
MITRLSSTAWMVPRKSALPRLQWVDPDAVLPGALGERGALAHAGGLVGVDPGDQLRNEGAHMLASLGDPEVHGHDQVVVVRGERAQTAGVLGAAQPHRHRRLLIARAGEGRGVGAAQGGGPGGGTPRRGVLDEGAEQQRAGDPERGLVVISSPIYLCPYP